jgi:hypothetical protein
MKMVLAGLLSLVLTTAASAANLGSAGSLETSGVDEADRHRAGKVQWKEIVGVITALNLDSPINDIDSGTFAWSARRGFAEVDLKTERRHSKSWGSPSTGPCSVARQARSRR